MPQSVITLCLGADEHYFPGLLLATLTTLQGLDPDRRYHFLFLDGGLRLASYEQLMVAMQAIGSQRGVEFSAERIEIELSAFDELPKIWGRSAMTYARILLPGLTDARDILWVDADMLLFKDLSRFTPQNRETCLLAGVQDSYVQWLHKDCPLPAEKQPAKDAPYLNCGLLWMNLDLMRKQDYKSRVLDFMERYCDGLAFWDQTALNNTAVGQVELLPDTWNTFCLDGNDKDLLPRLCEDNLHLVSKDKPWLGIIDPDHGPQPTRDFVFWNLYQYFTGQAIDDRLEWSRARITPSLRRRARWKRLAYGLGRNPYREEKWRELIDYYQRVTGGQMEAGVHERLQQWLQSTGASPSPARARR